MVVSTDVLPPTLEPLTHPSEFTRLFTQIKFKLNLKSKFAVCLAFILLIEIRLMLISKATTIIMSGTVDFNKRFFLAPTLLPNTGVPTPCHVIFKWPALSGITDSWDKICTILDLAREANCTMTPPSPSTMLDMQLHSQTGSLNPDNNLWADLYTLPSSLIEDPRWKIPAHHDGRWRIRRFYDETPTFEDWQLLSKQTRTRHEHSRDGNLELPNVFELSFSEKEGRYGGFWVPKWGPHKNLSMAKYALEYTQSLDPSFLLSAGNVTAHSHVSKNGQLGCDGMKPVYSKKVRGYAEANINRLFGDVAFTMLILRRGDRMHEYPENCVNVTNVAKMLLDPQRWTRHSRPQAILLATNEVDAQYLTDLRTELQRHFNVVATEQEFSQAQHNFFKFTALKHVFSEIAINPTRIHPAFPPLRVYGGFDAHTMPEYCRSLVEDGVVFKLRNIPL